MTFAFDIDGTLAAGGVPGDYEGAEPIPSRIQAVNDLYGQGHRIIIFTARGQLRGNTRGILNATRRQLKRWGLKFHELREKPAADVYVDNLAERPEEFFGTAEHMGEVPG